MALSEEEEEEYQNLLEEDELESARRNILDFTLYTFPKYQVNWHHRLVASYLDALLQGKIKRLMVFLHPRAGKSELVSRRLPALALGQNPDWQIIGASYAANLAQRMNRDVQRIMDDSPYKRLFPNIHLPNAGNPGRLVRNSDLFEIIGGKGSYRAAGIGGGSTGVGADLAIIDDPIKNRDDAHSKVKRDSQWEWFDTTLMTRLEQDARVLLTLTRWHEDDIAGRLMKKMEADPDFEKWVVVLVPAEAEGDLHPLDPRKPGEAMWPQRFPIEDLRQHKIRSRYNYASLYQQRPTPLEGGGD